MTAAKVGLVALALTSGCLRFGYDVARSDHKPDASQPDAGVQGREAGTPDAATSSNGGKGGSASPDAGGGGGAGGHGGSDAGSLDAGAARGGSAALDDDDAGPPIDVDQMVGDTGLHVSEILGYYNGDWGDMVFEAHGDEFWGVYNYSGGTVVGQIASDGVFTGWWSQSPTRTGNDAGEVEFRWEPKSTNPVNFKGRWRYQTSGGWLTNWNLMRVTDGTPPAALTDRFNDPNNFKRHP